MNARCVLLCLFALSVQAAPHAPTNPTTQVHWDSAFQFSVKFSWAGLNTESQESLLEYQVWRAQDLSGYSLRAVIESGKNSYTDTKTALGSMYRYKVRAVTSRGVSAYSAIVTLDTKQLKVPDAPPVILQSGSKTHRAQPSQPAVRTAPHHLVKVSSTEHEPTALKLSKTSTYARFKRERASKQAATSGDVKMPPGYRSVASKSLPSTIVVTPQQKRRQVRARMLPSQPYVLDVDTDESEGLPMVGLAGGMVILAAALVMVKASAKKHVA